MAIAVQQILHLDSGGISMRLVIFGVSNLLSNIFDCALAQGFTPSLVVMNTPEITRPRTKSVSDRIMQLPMPPRIVRLEDFSPKAGESYFVGTTSPQRKALVEDLRSRFSITCCTLVHPTAYVTPGARLANGVYVGAGSFIGAGCRLEEHVWIGSKVHVGHDTIVESYARLWPACNLAGNVRVGHGATVGMGANVIEELEIGPEAYIATGAAVVADVPSRAMVAGVPAEFKKTL